MAAEKLPYGRREPFEAGKAERSARNVRRARPTDASNRAAGRRTASEGRRRFDARLRVSLAAVAFAGAALALAGALLVKPSTGLSIGAGAALAWVNMWGLARIVAALLPDHPAGAEAQSRAGWGLVAVLKLGVLLGAVWLLLRDKLVSPLCLLAGFASLPIGIAIGALVSDRSAPSEDPPSPDHA